MVKTITTDFCELFTGIIYNLLQNLRPPNLPFLLQPGMMVAVNSTRDLSMTVGQFYLPFNRTTNEDGVFSLPYIDNADGGERETFVNLRYICIVSWNECYVLDVFHLKLSFEGRNHLKLKNIG